MITNFNLLWFDKTNVLEHFLFDGQHRPVHRHRPEHRLRVPAAAERERELHLRALGTDPRPGLPGPLQQLQRPDELGVHRHVLLLQPGLLTSRPVLRGVYGTRRRHPPHGIDASAHPRDVRSRTLSHHPGPCARCSIHLGRAETSKDSLARRHDRRAGPPSERATGGSPGPSPLTGIQTSRSALTRMGKAAIFRACPGPDSPGRDRSSPRTWRLAVPWHVPRRTTHFRDPRPAPGSLAARGRDCHAVRRRPREGLGRWPRRPRPCPARTASPSPSRPSSPRLDLSKQTPEMAAQKSFGCIQCHQGSHDPHCKETVRLGCVDCHGGDPTADDKQTGPRLAPVSRGLGDARPTRSGRYTLLNHESPEFIRFVNPGDLRIAHLSCGTVELPPQRGAAEPQEHDDPRRHALGRRALQQRLVPLKQARFGESYSMNGAPQRLQTVPAADRWEIEGQGSRAVPRPPAPLRGVAAGQRPADLRARRAAPPPRSASPTRSKNPGRPAARLSDRGLGTRNRTDPVFVSLTEDPAPRPDAQLPRHQRPPRRLSLQRLHRLPRRSTPTTARRSTPARTPRFGHLGLQLQPRPDDPQGRAAATRSSTSSSAGIPTSQCIVCHVHPGTNVHEQLHRLHVVGRGDRRRADVSARSRSTRRPRSSPARRCRNPDETAARGQLVRPGVPRAASPS